jgi:predicted HD superfamily hydrolase involved in NAD metabolism
MIFDIEGMKAKLKGMLSMARYRHSISTSRVASQLAAHYGAGQMKAMVAGLLHDCAKALTEEEQKAYIERNGLSLDEIESQERGLWHAPVGEVMAREEFGIDDHDILRAIRIHSIGAARMSLMAKVVYVADYIEPYRHFRGRADLARLAMKDLDLTLLHVLNHKLIYILHKKGMIHPDTIEVRNQLTRRIFGSD